MVPGAGGGRCGSSLGFCFRCSRVHVGVRGGCRRPHASDRRAPGQGRPGGRSCSTLAPRLCLVLTGPGVKVVIHGLERKSRKGSQNTGHCPLCQRGACGQQEQNRRQLPGTERGRGMGKLAVWRTWPWASWSQRVISRGSVSEGELAHSRPRHGRERRRGKCGVLGKL